ncbi:MAG: FtsX-like permease family protein [Phenylobacterium sp.]|uniref:ABC transporter permease n=1 Tax=Phenylobacterium sp. TaxID=1871053 RepID=UPI00391DFC0E
MRSLDRKLLRDLWRLKWQVAAIALLIACGVSVSVMAFSAQRALREAQALFYAQTRFADVFAEAKRAPLSLARELAAIDGVAGVDVRLVESGLLQAEGLVRPATVRLISLPAEDTLALNRVRLVQGRLPHPGRRDEVVALKTFLDAADIEPGSKLKAVIGGRAFTFTVVGAVLSAEHIYVPSPESFMPDDAHQAVLWAPRATVELASGMSGAFNEAALQLAAGASAPAAIQAMDRLLKPYGGRSAYTREDQVSHRFLEAEFKELSTSASILPPVFLAVAAALVHMVVARLVDVEREQIGLLKAFGYGDAEVSAPYLKFALAIGLVGVAGGGLAGAALGAAIIEQYRAYFRFPTLVASFHWTAFAAASLASVAAACAGSLQAARRAAALSPAVAMQPPRPAAYRRGVLDRLAPGGTVDQSSRMIVRNIERFPVRAGLTAAGLAASLSMLVGTQFLFGSIDRVIEQAYYQVQRWSDSIGFGEIREAYAVREALRLPGVFAAEPVRVVGAVIKANGRQERTSVTGLEPRAQLSRPLDGAGRPLPLLGRSVILSQALGERLGVAPGQMVRVEIVDGRAPAVDLPVTALAQDFSGFAIYMDRAELNRVMADGDVVSGAQLLVAPDQRAAFYRALEAVPRIIGASSRDDTVASWRQVMTEAFRVMITFYVGFASAIAFGVAYNTARIALSERGRDLATLRVLGFGQSECAYILLGELAFLAVVAIPLGLLGGQALAHGFTLAYSREELRIPLVITARSYGISLTAYALAVAAAGAAVGRRVWGLDLVSVLKTRE